MKEIERQIEENFGNSRIGRIRSFCWNMTEYPETGKSAQVLQKVSVYILLVTVLDCRTGELDSCDHVHHYLHHVNLGRVPG